MCLTRARVEIGTKTHMRVENVLAYQQLLINNNRVHVPIEKVPANSGYTGQHLRLTFIMKQVACYVISSLLKTN